MAAQIISWIAWYFSVTALGLLAFPLLYRLLPNLPDRGYAVSRALGLLLWGFIFWLLASLGILRNDTGGLVFAAALLGGLSLWALWDVHPAKLGAWLRSHARPVIVVELLFLLAFAGWAVVRAANPEALGTEKPMELAFTNAILNSPTFPPHDPWLSGYAISYYYFGYVMMAMLARLGETSGGVAFNLGLALVFALSAVGTYGLLYNLLNLASRRDPSGKPPAPRFTLAALLGPLYVIIVSNLEGVLQVLHGAGVFWQRQANGVLDSPFWTWLDIEDLKLPPQEPFSWLPTRFWWWWRASRVLQDYDLAQQPREIIDEFPFFSYLLGDLHPHVLAMPFAFLCMTLALGLFLGAGSAGLSGRWRGGWGALRLNQRILAWAAIAAIPLGILLVGGGALRLSLALVQLGILVLFLSGVGIARLWDDFAEYGLEIFVRRDLGTLQVGVPLQVNGVFFALAAVVLGGMAFLNIWDFPIYVGLCAAAYALGLIVRQEYRLSQAARHLVWMGLALGLAGGLLYLPFYLGFSSQAGGPLPNLIYPTRGAHLWVMFGTLLLPILFYLVYLAVRQKNRRAALNGFKLAGGGMLLVWLLALLFGLVIVITPPANDLFLDSLAANTPSDLFQQAIARRFSSPGGWISLLAVLGLSLGLLFYWAPRRAAPRPATPDSPSPNLPALRTPQPAARPPFPFSSTNRFVLLLIIFGALLVTGPEFFYLRDLFGWRMNTIFKFYFQAWLMWSIAAAYCVVLLLRNLRRAWGFLFNLLFVLLLAAGLVYPPLSLWEKTGGFKPTRWTLDSADYLARSAPEETEAAHWLQNAPPGVLAEAVSPTGGSYTEYARFATLSGQPNVLGWVGHENQWRGEGSVASVGSRQGDLARLYCTRDWDEAKTILERYNIRYVIIGDLERTTYKPDQASCPLGLVETKFTRNLATVFQSGPVKIYEYAPGAGSED